MAAVVGVLAALTVGAVPASASASDAAGTRPAPVVAAIDGSAASTPSTGLVSDGVRAAHPAAARTVGAERPPLSHAGGWAVAALLLLLAACALAVGVRRATTLAPPSARRSATAPRGPPALASC